MKSFIAEDSFWELFPQAAVGVVVVKGMKPAAQIPQEDVDAIAALLDRANIDAERHLTSDTISENVPVKAWREAYRLFKTKKAPAARSRTCSSACSRASRWVTLRPRSTSTTRCR